MEEIDFEQMLGNLSTEQIPTTPEGLIAMLTAFGPYIAVAVIAAMFLIATWSWRLFKLALPVEGALIFAMIGVYVVPMIPESVAIPYVDLGVAVVFVLALVGALIMKSFYKLAVVVIGAAGGWIAGTTISGVIAASFPDIAFFVSVDGKPAIGTIVVGAACALVVGILSVFIFKGLYIISTSVGGMICAFVTAGVMLFANSGIDLLVVMGVSTFIGIIAGVICCAHQFRTADD